MICLVCILMQVLNSSGRSRSFPPSTPPTAPVQVSYWRSFTAWELVLLGLLLLCQVLIAVAAVIELPHFVSDPVANRVLLLFHSIVLLNLRKWTCRSVKLPCVIY